MSNLIPTMNMYYATSLEEDSEAVCTSAPLKAEEPPPLARPCTECGGTGKIVLFVTADNCDVCQGFGQVFSTAEEDKYKVVRLKVEALAKRLRLPRHTTSEAALLQGISVLLAGGEICFRKERWPQFKDRFDTFFCRLRLDSSLRKCVHLYTGGPIPKGMTLISP